MRLKHLLLVALIGFGADCAAVDWSDVWWIPAESGWGVNVAQQADILYLTFFVYGADSQPHWYVAALTPKSTQANGFDTYGGNIFTSTGPWLGRAFDPSKVSGSQVGTATFSPQTSYRATLNYSIGEVNVSKTVERETWGSIHFVGNYTGQYIFESATCPHGNDVENGTIIVQLTAQTVDGFHGSVQTRFVFDPFTAKVGECVWSGEYAQWGSIINVSNTVPCTGGIDYTDISPSGETIQGRFAVTSGVCQNVYRYSASRIYNGKLPSALP